MSYKVLNKIRGIKGDIPKFTIGFKSLRDRMPQFIKEQKDIMKQEKNESIEWLIFFLCINNQ